MSSLPTGTVTFLFTDIEGSTRLLYELGAARYAAALDEHRRIIRAAVTAHGGVECGTEGDAFFVAFPTVQGAIEAVAQAQRDLAAGPIRVRMGLHTGTPLLTTEGYVGVDVHRAARIAAAGHGGQVLLTQSTVALTDASGFKDLGPHLFKDLAAAERVFQLGEQVFPPLKSLHRTNLPVPLTPFLGREAEVAAVSELLHRKDIRLVTLTGPGGTGKTRLAVRTAVDASDQFLDGIFWVPLAPLRDPRIVPSAVLRAIGSTEQTEKTPLESLIAALIGRRLLLVLDNAEHLMPGVALDIGALIASAPTVRLLVTSQERLRLQGEHIYPVPPLTKEDGVRLFLDRARAVDPTVVHSASVDTLCERLDQSPLALELAAARTGLYTAEELLARLGQRLDLLKGDRDRDSRQQTLRATIAWSFELLSATERPAFARLGVFAGGATLEAIEAVCEIDADTLQSLLDKNLLRRRVDGGPRFSMLETIRAYALERLKTDGWDATGERHLAHFLSLAERLAPAVRGADQTAALRRFDLEHDNLRAAFDFAISKGKTEEVFRLCVSLRRFWERRNYKTEGRERLAAALELGGSVEPGLRAEVLVAAGALANRQGDSKQALALSEQGRALFHQIGDRAGLARALGVLANAALTQGEFDQAERHAQRGLVLAEESGDEHTSSSALSTLGIIATERGDMRSGQEAFERVAILSRRLGDATTLARALNNLAFCAMVLGDLESAARLLDEALDRGRQVGDPLDLVSILTTRGSLALRQGDLLGAGRPFIEALRLGQASGDELLIGRCLQPLAALAARLGQARLAGRIMGAVDACFERLNALLRRTDLAENEPHLSVAVDQIGARAFASARAAGRLTPVQQVIDDVFAMVAAIRA